MDILFTHCGGKARVKDVVSALRAVNVAVVAITDFDVLDDSRELKALIAAFGIEWSKDLKSDMEAIYKTINTEQSAGNEVWKTLKKVGKAGFSGEAPAAYERAEKSVNPRGCSLFLWQRWNVSIKPSIKKRKIGYITFLKTMN